MLDGELKFQTVSELLREHFDEGGRLGLAAFLEDMEMCPFEAFLLS